MSISIDDSSMGKVGGAIGELLAHGVGAIAGELEMKSSVVNLSLFDIRSAIQISASEGSARQHRM